MQSAMCIGSHKIISKSATIPAILWFPEAAIRHLKNLFCGKKFLLDLRARV